MTETTLRDLLRERVADETFPDLTHDAWAAGTRLRRRRHVAAAGGAAVLVLAVVGGSVAVARDGRQVQPAPPPGSRLPTSEPTATPTSDPTPVDPRPVSREPDATFAGVPVWWSPDQVEERSLPAVGSQLPAEIDLSDRVDEVPYAVAAFAVGDEVLLTGPDGGQAAVDIAFLDQVTDPDGNRFPPTHAAMLSPTGRHLVFPQDGSVQVYTVPTGEWREVDTGDRPTRHVTWSGNDSFVLPARYGGLGDAFDVRGQPAGHLGWPVPDPGFDLDSATPFGRLRTGPLGDAQSWSSGPALPVRAPAYAPQPEFLSVDVDGEPVALAFMNALGDPADVRWKQCCPVASWLADDVVVYESRGAGAALVAWRVGTDEFRLVSRITGSYEVASFARLWQDLATVPR